MSARVLPFKRPVPKHDLVCFDADATFDAAWEAMLAAHRCERSGTHDPEAIDEGVRQAEHALKLFDWCVGHFAREAMYGDADAIDLESRARANIAATADIREKLIERSRKPADVIPLPWVKLPPVSPPQRSAPNRCRYCGKRYRWNGSWLERHEADCAKSASE